MAMAAETTWHCPLCGAAIPDPATCAQCGGTPLQRIVRRTFQALPHGLLAWRRASVPPGQHGLEAAWFAPAAAPADDLDFTVLMLPEQAGAGDAMLAGAALERLAARGVAYLTRDADPGAATVAELLQAMMALLAQQYIPCSVIAIDNQDPVSATRRPGWLLLRESGDAASWHRYLQNWHGAAALAPGHVAGLFAPLRAELAHWQAAQQACPFWWRDDDLVQDSPALRRLAALSRRHQAAVLMAVIPAQAEAGLASCATDAGLSTLVFCQHGWDHVNHEAPGQPPSEFGPGRDLAAAEADLARGAARLRQLCGARFLPVMVPPWNRLRAPLAARLPALGLSGLSQYLFQPRGDGVAGLVRIDTHLDIVDWRNGGGVREPAELIERLVALLALRRGGPWSEPLGILSHHRVMAEGSWRFLEQLHAVTAEFPCVRWWHPHQVFQGMAPCAA